jgi:hypothetical protein
MHPTAAEIARLASKYRTLGDLRRAKARGEAVPPRGVFKALAEEFPGALNELDMLPLDEIDRRRAALDGAATGAPVEPWMAWLHGYHALMRAALRVKGRLRKAREITDARAGALAAEATTCAGTPVGPDFVRAVARPPGGRITPVVLARLAALFEVDPEVILDTLFPHRRARRQR